MLNFLGCPSPWTTAPSHQLHKNTIIITEDTLRSYKNLCICQDQHYPGNSFYNPRRRDSSSWCIYATSLVVHHLEPLRQATSCMKGRVIRYLYPACFLMFFFSQSIWSCVPVWCLGQDMKFDCIDSWSLLFFYLFFNFLCYWYPSIKLLISLIHYMNTH